MTYICIYIALILRREYFLRILKILFQRDFFLAYKLVEFYDPNNIRKYYPFAIKNIVVQCVGIYGEKVELHLNDHVDYRFFYNSFFDRTLYEITKELDFLPSETLIIDIGANVGLVSLGLALVGYRIYAIEPLPFHISKLKRNMELNSIQFPVIPVALSDKIDNKSKQMILYSPRGNSGATSFDTACVNVGRGLVIEHSVEISTLDKVLSQIREPFKRLILKIDVEGMELLVLNGGAKTINDLRPIILMEWKSLEFIKDRAIKLNSFLLKNSYNVLKISFLRNQERILLEKFSFDQYKYENIILWPKESSFKVFRNTDCQK